MGMSQPNINVIIAMAERVRGLRQQLEAAERDLAAAAGGRRAPTPAPQSGKSAPVAHRVKKLLASGRPLTFSEVHQGVLKAGPASKFAVRSALGKARARGVVRFDGVRYSMGKTEAPLVVRRKQKSPGPRGPEAKLDEVEITF